MTDPNDTINENQDLDEDEVPAMRLDDLLKFFNVASSGGHAKHLIQSGEVQVNGAVETRRKRKILHGDVVQAAGEKFVVELIPTDEA